MEIPIGTTRKVSGRFTTAISSTRKKPRRCVICDIGMGGPKCKVLDCSASTRSDKKNVHFTLGKYSNHAPSIEGDNQAGRLYRFLKRHFGKEFSTLALANEIDTVALHSVKNHVDQQLPKDERINVEWRRVNGKRRVYYSLVKVGGGKA